jgi:eukaryotic-like serine/threonine-protein kinase
MARSASKESIAADGTRFGDGEVGADVVEALRGSRLRAGSVIDGKYRLERVLGEGGMGSVWCAHHLQLDLPVAIKLLRSGPDNVTLSERLKLEARASAQLVHPAIVRVFDVDTSEHGEPFIVMELLGGENLADLLDRGRLSCVSAVQLLLPIAEALALAHAKGIVHRDLKPPNVFLAQEGERMQPKLLDFGIAKLTSPQHSGSLTDTGVSVGSPDYMSPEQARGSRDIDHRADIWSFSVVLYEAVTGSTPFEGDNYNALMRAIVEDEPAPLPIDDNLDQGLADLISWGLAKDRSQRPGSIQELGRELARWLIDRGVTEDVCGSPLGPKWITRVAQKSVPVIQLDAPEPAKPAPVVRTGTLVSARNSNSVVREPRQEPRSKRLAFRRPLGWVLAAAALAVGGGLAWGLAGRASLEGRGVSGPVVGSPSPAVQKAPRVGPSLEQQPGAIGVAPTAPAPTEVVSTKPSPSAASPSLLHSATAGVPQSKPHDGKPAAAAAPSATKPARDVHDETRELLQAY